MSVFCWDFDGTLAYSVHLWSNSVFRALNETVDNHSVTFQDIRRCNASGFTWHTPDEDFTDLVAEKWWEFMNAHFYRSFVSLGVSEEQSKLASEKVRDIIMLPQNYNLFDDTVSVLKKAEEKGHTNIILSNNYPELEKITDALGITRFFDRLVVSGIVGYDKPRKEIFDIAKSFYP
ncbi:MAG: HAD family hydrolase, partial [Clostridia bacterium]|nr:HAD family hydrolase [Clostridia bacterium]